MGFRATMGRVSAILPALTLAGSSIALAQDPPPPPPSPPLPSAATPAAAPTREAELEDRVRQLEAMVQQLSNQMSRMGSAAAPAPAPAGTGAPPALIPGQSLPANPPASARFDTPATLENKPAKVKFGPGFDIRTEDDEFILQFHNLTQFDYRGYEQGAQNPVRDTFGIPRQWFMFSGRAGRNFGYFLSLANGFDTVGILDVFVDVDTNPKLKIRAGRMKTPFTYEFLIEPIQGLITPERSLFFNNFGQNRDEGVMLFGRLFDNKFDYAVGIYNGTRNGFLAQNDFKHVSSLLNYKPFNNWTDHPLENFNIGGSVYGGLSDNAPQPTVFRTAVPTAGNPIVGVPWLTLNSNVREQGFQGMWDLHTAYFYKQLAVIAEWGSGRQPYAVTGKPFNRTYMPVESYYVQVGYLLTGETRSSVGVVKPRNPVGFRNGQYGIGAWELTARYDSMNIGRDLITNGLTNGKNWTNSLYMTDIGFNWHMTQYVKLMFDWEHAVFGNPVLYAPGKYHLTSDMFMLRLQLFF